jgi:polyhydroxyalkanoate synthase
MRVSVQARSGPAHADSANVEELAQNIARMVEEGGKALAALLRPREAGRGDEQHLQVVDVVKTLGQVASYWLRDPQRNLEIQSTLGRVYLDLCRNAAKRMAGEHATAMTGADPRDRRFADPEWSSNQFFDFLKQAYLLTVCWAHRLVNDASGAASHPAVRSPCVRGRTQSGDYAREGDL